MKQIFGKPVIQLLVLLAIAAALRTGELGNALTYDEIWTLDNYSNLPISRIFSDLELPNNQPLNTVSVKILAAVLPIPAVIRLHSFFAGVASVALLWSIAYAMAGRRAAFWSGLFLAASAPAALYSELARGYELQLCFLLLAFAGFAASGKLRPKRLRYLPEAAIVAGGVGALLTLPTSAIYLAAGVLALWLREPRRPQRSIAFVTLGGAVFTLIYFAVNFAAFETGRQWGTPITSAAEFGRFAADTLTLLCPAALFPPMALSLIARPPERGLDRKNAALLLVPALVLLSALATKAGPPRVYLPLAAIFALLMGLGIDRAVERIDAAPRRARWTKIPVFLLALAAAALQWIVLEGNPAWHLPDWKRICREIAAEIPSETLVVYRATDGYPVMWNNAPEIFDDTFRRLADRSERRTLMMFDEPGSFNGSNAGMGEEVRRFPAAKPEKLFAAGQVSASLYRLERLRELPAPGLPVIAVIGPAPEAAVPVLARLLAPRDPFQLNIWLNSTTKKIGGVDHRGLLLLLAPEAVTRETLDAVSRYGETVALYQVR